MLIESSGKDITETSFKEIVKNKNPHYYTSGFSCIEALLPPGDYTVVVAPEMEVQVGSY